MKEGFCPLASGSQGNVTYLRTPKAKILVDAGLTTRATKLRLEEIGASLEEIDAILITHDHIDHIRGLNVMALKLGIPIITNAETAKSIVAKLGSCPKFMIFTTGEPFKFKDLYIEPFSIPHDTADPVAFSLSVDGIKVSICTDLGYATPIVRKAIQKSDFLVLEANHKPEWVHACSRPQREKERVLGKSGHLSNEASGELLADSAHCGLKHVHLAHLSSECNSHEMALKTVKEVLLSKGITGVPISIAFQKEVSKAIEF